MKRRIAIIFVLFTVGAYAQAPAAAVRNKLAATNIFAFGGVGYAGVTSEGELLFELIMAKPQAMGERDFEELYATGNPEAKAYALAGIRKLDRQRFQTLLLPARASAESVETMSGCVLETKPLNQVADDLDAGRYDVWLYRSDKKDRSTAESSSKPLGGWLHR